jgi:hypothetical protein
VASVFLVQIIGNSILFVRMNATTAYSHASQDPWWGRHVCAYGRELCVHTTRIQMYARV